MLPALEAVLAEPDAAGRIVLTGISPPAPSRSRCWTCSPASATERAGYAATPAVSWCSCTPRDDEEMVLVDSRLDRWAEVLAGVPEEVRTVVCGLTHMPYVRLAHRRLVIDPDSVGMPYGGAGAHWTLRVFGPRDGR